MQHLTLRSTISAPSGKRLWRYGAGSTQNWHVDRQPDCKGSPTKYGHISGYQCSDTQSSKQFSTNCPLRIPLSESLSGIISSPQRPANQDISFKLALAFSTASSILSLRLGKTARVSSTACFYLDHASASSTPHTIAYLPINNPPSLSNPIPSLSMYKKSKKRTSCRNRNSLFSSSAVSDSNLSMRESCCWSSLW